MSDQARIAEVLRRHRRVLNLDSGTSHCFAARSGQCDFAGGVRADWEAHVAPLIDAALHPRIETPDQLHELPHKSVVLAASVYPFDKYDTMWWHDGVSHEAEDVPLPAIVLYTPEVNR